MPGDVERHSRAGLDERLVPKGIGRLRCIVCEGLRGELCALAISVDVRHDGIGRPATDPVLERLPDGIAHQATVVQPRRPTAASEHLTTPCGTLDT